jgi:UDP-2-acetamido-3-amino-2,3-dideoxy-glucuronate N-acetyltransferase
MSEFGHKLSFNSEGIAICPESDEKYKLENGTVTKLE